MSASGIRDVLQSGNMSVGEQINVLLHGLGCVIPGKTAVYVSGPITTGRRFLNWFATEGRQIKADKAKFGASRRKLVVIPNELEILDVAQELRKQGKRVIEPVSLQIEGWSQSDYHQFWAKVIRQFVERVVVLPNWQYSVGCAIEFCSAIESGTAVEDMAGAPIDPMQALPLLRKAAADLAQAGTGIDLVPILTRLEALAVPHVAMLDTLRVSGATERHFRKDESLNRLADIINVAQFVSFSPADGLRQEYSRIRGRSPNERFRDARSAVEEVLAKSTNQSVNVRSFKPESPQSHEFVYGIKTLDDALAATTRLSAQGLHTIVNETIDIRDGGVSGVVQGNVIEFAPDDKPRCVEKPGVASLPRQFAIALLSLVYRFTPDIDVHRDFRLEFSLHPRAVGWRATHTLGWEIEEVGAQNIEPSFSWPNRFSRFLGDKAFGLLVADVLGLPVPRTTVFSRRVAPFWFGQSTGSREIWIRTCPTEQVPGHFTTHHGWLDPFSLMASEDPKGSAISSVLSQENVPASYSGAAIVGANQSLIIEGKQGEGESFMLGVAKRETLPGKIRNHVSNLYEALFSALGPVRFEWVHDGARAWIVQLHRGATQTSESTIVPGHADRWVEFDIQRGLKALRDLLSHLETGDGVVIQGEIGLTSHLADVLRKANYPARLSVPDSTK